MNALEGGYEGQIGYGNNIFGSEFTKLRNLSDQEEWIINKNLYHT